MLHGTVDLRKFTIIILGAVWHEERRERTLLIIIKDDDNEKRKSEFPLAYLLLKIPNKRPIFLIFFSKSSFIWTWFVDLSVLTMLY